MRKPCSCFCIEFALYARSADHANVPGKPHHRNASYTYNDYFVEYAPFVRQYRDAGMPGRRLQGGTFAGSSWNKYIPDLILAYGAEMATYSMHKYARTTCNDRTVTQASLLAYAAAGGQMGPVAEVAARPDRWVRKTSNAVLVGV
eukprot:m.1063172 g.1063172  ORF g.1063172 m.1063172 type:complete len:145 (-) comp24215_c0_seq72:2347-2781(-)